jgi:hypothetical protein
MLFIKSTSDGKSLIIIEYANLLFNKLVELLIKWSNLYMKFKGNAISLSTSNNILNDISYNELLSLRNLSFDDFVTILLNTLLLEFIGIFTKKLSKF